MSVDCWIDNDLIQSIAHVDQQYNIKIHLPIEHSEHELKIILSNKQPGHTVVDTSGAIVNVTILSGGSGYNTTPPVTVADSGGGIHAYWPLTEPVSRETCLRNAHFL